MKMTKRDAVRVAIAYANVFDYPLTKEEVRVWAPYVTLGSFPFSVQHPKKLMAIRKDREHWSEEKWERARRVAALLRLIITITLVGVTGGLARWNAKREDDIDFLILAAPGTMWVTRAIATTLLDVLRLRRRPTDTQFQNLICLNMFMSEESLAVQRPERDLFTAHEVLLMTPIWERGGAHRKFLQANRWVAKFLPNAWKQKCQMINDKWPINKRKIFSIWHLAFSILEPFAKHLQLWYMKKRRSTEVVSDTLIRFHPRDARVWIKRALGRRLSRLNIPLDKIFYCR